MVVCSPHDAQLNLSFLQGYVFVDLKSEADMQRALKRKKEYLGKGCLFPLALADVNGRCSAAGVFAAEVSALASVFSRQMVGVVSPAQLTQDKPRAAQNWQGTELCVHLALWPSIFVVFLKPILLLK